MAIQFDTLDNRSGETWISPERYFLTQDGRVVLEGNADAAFLLVGKGGSLSHAEAEKYGLTRGEKLTEAELAVVKDPESDDSNVRLDVVATEQVVEAAEIEEPAAAEPVKAKPRKK